MFSRSTYVRLVSVLWTLLCEVFKVKYGCLYWSINLIVKRLLEGVIDITTLDSIDVAVVFCDRTNIECLFIAIEFQVDESTEFLCPLFLSLQFALGYPSLFLVYVDLSLVQLGNIHDIVLDSNSRTRLFKFRFLVISFRFRLLGLKRLSKHRVFLFEGW